MALACVVDTEPKKKGKSFQVIFGDFFVFYFYTLA
jgi:hypothetical protein